MIKSIEELEDRIEDMQIAGKNLLDFNDIEFRIYKRMVDIKTAYYQNEPERMKIHQDKMKYRHNITVRI